MAAKKRKSSETSKAAVSAKLRAMVEDVAHWPMSDQLLRAIEDLEAAPEDAAPPAPNRPKKN